MPSALCVCIEVLEGALHMCKVAKLSVTPVFLNKKSVLLATQTCSSVLLCHQGQIPTKVTLKRFYRPEDISIDAAYKAELYEVYSSNDKQCVDVDSLVGRCSVGLLAGVPG